MGKYKDFVLKLTTKNKRKVRQSKVLKKVKKITIYKPSIYEFVYVFISHKNYVLALPFYLLYVMCVALYCLLSSLHSNITFIMNRCVRFAKMIVCDRYKLFITLLLFILFINVLILL